MNTYETTGTVEVYGQVHLAGVPFEPGTAVNVTISPTRHVTGEAVAEANTTVTAARERMQELFRTVNGFRNSPRIPREELYDRGSLH